jgi:light-regulated signal transduction histidine kinase (bacteriophytochrome)
MVEAQSRDQELKQVVLTGLHDMQESLDEVARYLHFVEARYKGRLDSETNEFIADAVHGANRMEQIILDLQKRVGDL